MLTACQDKKCHHKWKEGKMIRSIGKFEEIDSENLNNFGFKSELGETKDAIFTPIIKFYPQPQVLQIKTHQATSTDVLLN